MNNNTLYIYGAGAAGIKFKNNFQDIVCKYNCVQFLDQDKSKIGQIIDGVKVISPEDAKEGDIIITNFDFFSVYLRYWNKDKISILGIYIQENNEIYDYKTACLIRKTTFYNEFALKYYKDANKIIESNINRYKNSRKLYEAIGTIHIELSNICNYSSIHKKCPLNREQEKVIMSIKKIKKIINELELVNYDGVIGFYIYNEPLIDPRLFYIMEMVKNKLPKCRIELTTNAFYFNQTMLNELFEYGCNRLTVSAYGYKEFERLISYEIEAPYVVYYSSFDDRLNQYRETEIAIKNKQCSSFINFVGISCTGDLYLCCMDYEKRFKLGNVFESNLKELLNGENIKYYTDNLIEGNRNICNLCKNCEMEF
ncbi:MAG: SPASM domain-containing protein [Lachnospiraceae bacterium]|nr:SPASM domain-containing protein [Lachnospiraceae bacterium]